MANNNRALTVGLYTLGCKVSQYETEAIAEKFADRGFTVCDFSEVCSIYVINTCTVTAESDRKCRQIIRRAMKKNPDAFIIAVGCYTQRDPDTVKKLGVHSVIGTENKLSAVDEAVRLLSGNTEARVSVTDLKGASFEPMMISRAPRTRAYVKIEDGCESKCTYCAIASARGPIRSKPVADVVSEVEGLYKSGTKEIVLTGIETGAYGRDLLCGEDLASLIRLLDSRKSCERIRLGSLAPELIRGDFVTRVADCSILVPHFHLSIQSGSDSVLGRMKRRYNRKMVLDLVNEIKKKIKGATFTTDLMVGFPGESEEEFSETLSIVEEIGLLDAHVFAYSKRKGTEAAELDGQISEDIKKKRSEMLIAEKNRVRDIVLDGILHSGATLYAVAETFTGTGYHSHSDSYVEIFFETDCPNLTGEIVKVRPVSHKDGIMYCELI